MHTAARRTLYWCPRILTIVFILFLGLFALDVFSEGTSPGETLVALCMHLIPNFVLVAVLILSWRREWIGAILFTGLGVSYIVLSRGPMHWSAYVAIAGPLFLLGFLFSLGWSFRRELRPTADA